MSTSIEQRVVQMRFDNKQFEAGVAQSMSTLDKFKAKLNFKGAADSFNDISKAADRVSLDSLITQTDNAGNKFDALAIIAISALNRITNEAISAGTKLVKSLSIDQVSSGWQKYEARTAAVQTLVNATGRSVEDIERYMSKLMTYSDETSYGFADMTAALGTMVSAGGDIDKLVPVLEGFGNAVSFVGKGANEYSRAIIQLSQGYGRNALMLEDWKSIEQTLGGAKQLKEVFIEVGEELGKIQKGQIDVGTFNETLRNKWLDQEVIEEALGRFAEMTERAFAMIEAGEAETVSEAYEILSRTVDDYRIRAAKAAQEAKSFTEAIDATKDAVSTKWMESFQIIFGNYEEATRLWTELTNTLYELFAASGDVRNEILSIWKSIGGRETMIKAFKAAFEALAKPVSAVRDAIHEIFFPGTTLEKGIWLARLTNNLRAFFESLILSDEAVTTLRKSIKILLLPVYAFYQALRIVTAFIGQTIITVFSLIDALLSLPSKLGDVENPLKKIFGDERYTRIVSSLAIIIENLGNALYAIGSAIFSVGQSIASAFSSRLQTSLSRFLDALKPVAEWILDRIVDGFELLASLDYSKIVDWAITGINSLVVGFGLIGAGCENAIIAVKGFFDQFKDMDAIQVLNALVTGVANLKTNFQTFIKSLGFTQIMAAIKQETSGVTDVIATLGEAIQNLVSRLTPAKILVFGFGASLVWVFTNLAQAIAAFKKVADGVTGVFTGITGVLKAFQQKLKGSPILQIAVAIGVLALALGALSQIDSDRLTAAALSLGGLIVALGLMVAGMAAVNKFLLGSKEMAESFETVAKSMIMMSAAVGVLSASLFVLSKVDMEGMGLKLLSLGAILLALIAVMKIGGSNSKTSIKDALYILAFAASLNMMVKALGSISQLQLSNSVDNIMTLTAVILLMIGLSKAAKEVKFSSGLAMIMMVGALLVFIKALTPIANLEPGGIILALLKFIPIFALLAVIFRSVGDGNAALKTAGSLAAIGAALVLIYFAIKNLGEMDLAVLTKGTIAVGALMLFVAGMNAIAKLGKGDASMMKLEGSFLALSAAILVLGVAINYIGGLELRRVVQGTIVVGALISLLSLLAKAIAPAQKATGAVIAMSICIGLIVAAVGIMSLLDAKDLLAAGTSLGMAFLGLAAMFKAIEYLEIKNAISAMLVILSTLALVGLLFIRLDRLEKPDKVLPVAGGIGIVIVALGASLALIGSNKSLETANIKRIGRTLALMAGILLAVGVVIGALGWLPVNSEGIIEKAGAVGLVLLALGKSIDLFNVKTAKWENVQSTIRLIRNMAILAGAVVAVLSFLPNPDGILWKATAFSEILLVLSGVVAGLSLLASRLKKIDDGVISDMQKFAIIAGGLGVLATAITAVLALIPADDRLLKKVGTFAIVLGALVIAVAIITSISKGLEALGKAGFGAIKGAAVAGAIIVALGALIAVAMGVMTGIVTLIGLVLSSIPELESYLTIAENVLPRIGSLIGDFFGKIVGEFVGGTLDSMGPSIADFGTYLSEFANNVQDFLNLKVDPAFTESITALTDAVMSITSAEFIKALLGTEEEHPFETFGEELNKFAPKFVKFANTVGDAPLDGVYAAAACLDSLGYVLANIPTEGGMMDKLFGHADFDGFSDGLEKIGEAIAKYADSIANTEISQDTLDKTKILTDMLIELTNKIPPTDGLLQYLVGEHDFQKFGFQLSSYADALYWFIVATNDIKTIYDQAAVNAAISTTDALIDLANKVPLTGKLMTFFGEHDIGEFGYDLWNFGIYLKRFFGVLNEAEMKQETVDSAKYAGDALVELANKVPSTGKLIDFIGGPNIGTFGEQVGTFGQGLADFFKSITDAGVDKLMIRTAKDAGMAFVEIANALEPQTTGALWWETTTFDTFGDQIGKLGSGIKSFYTNSNGTNWDDVKRAVESITQIAEAAPSMASLDSAAANNFKQYLADLGTIGLTSFTETFSGSQGDIAAEIYRVLNSALISAKRLLKETPTSYSFMIDSIMAGIDGHNDEIVSRAIEIAELVHSTMLNEAPKLEEVGSLIVLSVINGFATKDHELGVAVGDMTKSIVDKTKTTLDVRSNLSEEFRQVGKYCIDGFVKGLDDNSSELYSKITTLGNNIVSKFETSMGVNSPSKKFAEVGMYSVLGFNKGIDDNLRSAEKTMIKMGEDLLETIQEFYGIHSPSTLMRDEVGRYIIMGIAEGIENEMSAEEAAAAKARAILEAFQEEFNRWSLNINTAELENKLWSTIHSNATESEVYDQQKILLDKQLTYQAERVNAANVQYQAILEALGSEAKETQEAYNTYLKEQTTMWEYANEYEKLLTGSGGTIREESDSYYQILREYGGMLEEAGFTMDQIKEYAKKQSGMDAYFNTDSSGMLKSAKTAAEIVDKYMASASGSIDGIPGQVEYTLELSLQQVSNTVGSYGSSIGSSLGQGITSSFEQVISGSGGIGSTIQNALGIEGDNAWDLGSFIGENLGGGGIDGIRNTLKSAGDAGVNWVKNLFQGITNTAEINSPSKVTYRYGEYIIQGLNNGMTDTADLPIDTASTMLNRMFDLVSEVPNSWYDIGIAAGQGLANGLKDANSMVRNAAYSLASNAYTASADALDVNSPSKEYYYLGQMIDQGLANGIVDSATVVQRAITKVMDKAQETVGNTNLKAVISPVATGSTRGKAYYTKEVAKMMATDPSFNGQLLQWDATGTLIPYGVNNHAQNADKGRWWIAPTAEIAASIREFKDSEDARRAYEQATMGQYTGTMEELKQAIKELSEKPSDINFTQNNYSPSSLSSSTIYRNTRSALAIASANASPTGRSQTGKGVAGGLPMPT